ncbi:MAG: hypothetical protein FJ317_06310, partial [SAR202 cluster bacterium]|nr:hypothetical protein [SAR202 cluster bacterium]
MTSRWARRHIRCCWRRRSAIRTPTCSSSKRLASPRPIWAARGIRWCTPTWRTWRRPTAAACSPSVPSPGWAACLTTTTTTTSRASRRTSCGASCPTNRCRLYRRPDSSKERPMTNKRIAIFGVGAIGGCLGGYLTRAGVDVSLIDAWPANIEAIRASSLQVKSLEEEFTAKPKEALHLTDVYGSRRQWDIVFLAMKSQDTVWATRFIEPHLATGGYVVSAQNSINDDTIAELLGWPRVVGCVVTFGAGVYEPGRPEYTSPSSRVALIFGEPSGLITKRVSELVDIVGKARLVKTTTNLWGERWA